MADVIQANLKPQTIERIEDISGKPVTRGLDRMINECFDKLAENSPEKPREVGKCADMMKVIQDEEE